MSHCNLSGFYEQVGYFVNPAFVEESMLTLFCFDSFIYFQPFQIPVSAAT